MKQRLAACYPASARLAAACDDKCLKGAWPCRCSALFATLPKATLCSRLSASGSVLERLCTETLNRKTQPKNSTETLNRKPRTRSLHRPCPSLSRHLTQLPSQTHRRSNQSLNWRHPRHPKNAFTWTSLLMSVSCSPTQNAPCSSLPAFSLPPPLHPLRFVCLFVFLSVCDR